MKKSLLLLIVWISTGLVPMTLWAQVPFVCDGDFYLSLTPSGQGSVSTFYRLTVDPTNAVAFSIFPNAPLGVPLNAIGYRSTDNLIYGMYSSSHGLVQIDSTGTETLLAFLTGINSSQTIISGDMKPDGNEFVLLARENGADKQLVKVDMNDPTYGTTSIPLVTASSGNTAAPTSTCADMAFDPTSGILYGYYGGNVQQLITIDIQTGVVDDVSFPPGQIGSILGSMFFDAFGDLYSYGRPSNGSLQNTLFSINKTTGIVSILATGPSANGTDGCSCPYTVQMKKKVDTTAITPCTPVVYTFVIANSSGIAQTGIDFEDVMPVGLTVSSILNNPFGGNVSGIGTNVLSISNMNIPLGIDSMEVEVYVEPLAVGFHRNQASLSNLPLALGEEVISDNPFTPITLDSSYLTVLPDTIDVPNQQFEICTGDTLILDASQHQGLLYLWSDGSSASSLLVTQGGQYSVISMGCDIVLDTIDVIEHALPVVVANTDTVICAGSSAQLQANGASSYQWSPSIGLNNSNLPNPSANPPDTTVYVVIGTDLNGCQDQDSVQVDVRPLPVVDAGPDMTICDDDTVQMGVPLPVGSYLWSSSTGLDDPMLPQPIFIPINAGSFVYTLTATGPEGCTQTDDMMMTVHEIDATYTFTDVVCNGANDATSTVLVNPGTAPFIYSWIDNNGTTVQSFNSVQDSVTAINLGPGSYFVQVVDGNGCEDVSLQVISEPAALQSSISSQSNIDCFGNNTGSVTVTGSGGISPYEYALDGGGFGTSGTFLNLGALQYSVTVRDANGCETDQNVIITTPTGLYGVVLSAQDIGCNGNATGELVLQGNGGTAPYEYSLDGVSYSNNPVLSSLSAGTDTAWMRDDNNCLVSIPFTLTEPPVLSASIVVQKNVDCFGNANGALELLAMGGSSPYLFSLDNGPPDSLGVFDGLAAGNYSVLVIDDSACQTTIPVVISEPPLLDLTLLGQQNVDCFGNATGVVTVEANGGAFPYQFAIDSFPFDIVSTFGGLAKGAYSIHVRDDSSCVTSLEVDITEPTPLLISLQDQANVACFGENTAWIMASGEGGTRPYQFSLEGGGLTADSLFSNLTAGEYTLILQDDSSCTDSLMVRISEPAPLIVGIKDQTNIDCFGNATGQFGLTVGGGVMPYTFALDQGAPTRDSVFTDLVMGTYQIQVKDDSSCITLQEVILTEPDSLSVHLEVTGVRCFGEENGSIQATVSGGTEPYFFQWNTEPTQSSALASSLPRGLYQVLIEDALGCKKLGSAEVGEPLPLVISLVEGSISEAYCDWANGSAEVSAVGGTDPYTYHWGSNPERQAALAEEVFGGRYLATVTDVQGCQDTIRVDIPHVPPPIAMFHTSPSFEDSILESRASIKFHNETEGGVVYKWEFGDAGRLSDEEHPSYFYTEPGEYEVILTAYNQYLLCPDEYRATLHIIPDGKLYFPNAFTPNGDGHNDVFLPKGEGIVSFELIIMNRWGQLIARLSSMDQGWNGNMEGGGIAPEGGYMFVAKATFNNGTQLERSGTITLIR
ncbi:MAG: gliding motility-associated C-terminal domain-containing protein [Bacteroidota bacterium]